MRGGRNESRTIRDRYIEHSWTTLPRTWPKPVPPYPITVPEGKPQCICYHSVKHVLFIIDQVCSATELTLLAGCGSVSCKVEFCRQKYHLIHYQSTVSCRFESTSNQVQCINFVQDQLLGYVRLSSCVNKLPHLANDFICCPLKCLRDSPSMSRYRYPRRKALSDGRSCTSCITISTSSICSAIPRSGRRLRR